MDYDEQYDTLPTAEDGAMEVLGQEFTLGVLCVLKQKNSLGALDVNSLLGELKFSLPRALRELAGMIERGRMDAKLAGFCADAVPLAPERVFFLVNLRHEAPIHAEMKEARP